MTDCNINGIHFQATADDVIGSAKVFSRGQPEANDTGLGGHVREMEAFIQHTGHLKVLLDVGACVGIYSLVFTRTPGTTAFALEPSPSAFPVLVTSCQANPERHIVPIQAFIGEVNGRPVHCGADWLHVVADEGKGDAWHRQFVGKPIAGGDLNFNETTLDSLKDPRDGSAIKPDCIKIDVEGHECKVLRGAQETITTNRPTIFIEVHSSTLRGHGESWNTVLELLHGYGYRVLDFDGNEVDNLNCGSVFRGSVFRCRCIPKD